METELAGVELEILPGGLLVEGLGEKVPTARIPRGVMRPVLVLWQYLHFRVGAPAPPLTPHELDKVTITHYGSIKDAERDFGYRPATSYQDAIELCIPYCRDLHRQLKKQA